MRIGEFMINKEHNSNLIHDLLKKFREDFKVDCAFNMFPQLWGSTSLGYNGFGGSAMTTANTYVIYSSEIKTYRIYFGGELLAYELKNPNKEFFKDLKQEKLAGQDGYKRYMNE